MIGAMHVRLMDVGRRYNNRWVLRHINLNLAPDQHTVILGPNGSGKSTLVQLILGSLIPSEGVVEVTHQNQLCDAEHQLGLFSLSAPYLELVEEFTLDELLNFHFKLVAPRNQISPADMPALAGLESARKRQVRHFSSGMKQRVRLLLAVLADTPCLLLDEPTANLDSRGIDWYQKLVSAHLAQRTVVVASNSQEAEFGFCTQRFELSL